MFDDYLNSLAIEVTRCLLILTVTMFIRGIIVGEGFCYFLGWTILGIYEVLDYNRAKQFEEED